MTRSRKARYYIPNVDTWPKFLSIGTLRVRKSAMALTLRDIGQDLDRLEADLVELQQAMVKSWGTASVTSMQALGDRRRALMVELRRINKQRAHLLEEMDKVDERMNFERGAPVV